MLDAINEDKQALLTLVFSQYGISQVAIFGSFSRGEATDASDIDLLVRFRKPVSLLRFIDLKQKLESLLGKPVDLVQYKSIKSKLRPYILKDAKTIYTSEQSL